MKSCVVIVLKNEDQGFGVIGEISGRDGVVHDWDHDRGIIEATVESGEVGALAKHNAVAYVRPFMCYTGGI